MSHSIMRTHVFPFRVAAQVECLHSRRQYGAIWRQLFEQAKKDGLLRVNLDTAPIQMFILGALNWTSEWLDPQRTDLEAAAARFSDVVLNGLLARRSVSARRTDDRVTRFVLE